MGRWGGRGLVTALAARPRGLGLAGRGADPGNTRLAGSLPASSSGCWGLKCNLNSPVAREVKSPRSYEPPDPAGPAAYQCSVVEDDFHDAVDPAVEAVVQVRGLVQCRVVGDDLAGPGAPADDQVPQVRGVPAIVGAPESDRNALVEQRCPGHVQRPVGMASVRGGRRVGGGEHAG